MQVLLHLYMNPFANLSTYPQDISSARDSEFAENLNGLLQDPNYELRWGSPAASGAEASTSAAVSQPTASSYVIFFS